MAIPITEEEAEYRRISSSLDTIELLTYSARNPGWIDEDEGENLGRPTRTALGLSLLDEIFQSDHALDSLYQQEVDGCTNQTDGVSEEIISQFLNSRSRQCRPGAGGGEDDLQEICMICQSGYEREEETVVAALDCGHKFHESCIHRWLTLNNSCPLCRREAIN